DRKSTRLNSSHVEISYAVSLDRKSTRLNSSHVEISYAVFCLKKNKTTAHGAPPAAGAPCASGWPPAECLASAPRRHSNTTPPRRAAPGGERWRSLLPVANARRWRGAPRSRRGAQRRNE